MNNVKTASPKKTSMTVKDMPVRIPADGVSLEANLTVPPEAKAIVVFAHGSGSDRHSPRNRAVAQSLDEQGFATLLADLLTPEEEKIDNKTRQLRFDISMLAERLIAIADWLGSDPDLRDLQIGWFGASTGAGAALIAAARHPQNVMAVVSRGGRPDLADNLLSKVKAPTLLIVGENDPEVLDLNRQALAQLNDRSELEIVSGATHLFEEPGALEKVTQLAGSWFQRHSQ